MQQNSLDLLEPFDWSAVKAPAPLDMDIAPSKIDELYEGGSGDVLAMQRGNYIHEILEQQSEPAPFVANIKSELPENICIACQQEAEQLLSDRNLIFLFDPQQYVEAKKEVGLQYPTANGKYVYGVIDRLVITTDCIYIIDYKTHQHVTLDNADSIAEHYRSQLQYYADGVQQIYPDKRVIAGILFTHNRSWIEVI
jgi:ATP-dependent helicase/nuclease subunit A